MNNITQEYYQLLGKGLLTLMCTHYFLDEKGGIKDEKIIKVDFKESEVEITTRGGQKITFTYKVN